MNWDLMDKYDAVDVGGATGAVAAAGAASRDVELDIDTDVVLDNLDKMAKALTTEQQSLLAGFSLGGAWSSTNATLVEEKVEAINKSFAEMQGIIEELKNKVNTYVTNAIEADKVNFTSGSGE